ncbi:MAG: POTRA domain-containing protein, partial [Bacteroidota bacterium]
MRNLTLFFLLIPCWLKAQPLPAPGPAYMLADLKIEGLQQSNPEVVREQLGLSAGQLLHVPGPAATEALKRLWRMGIFADLNLEISHQTADSIWLTLRVEEAPRLSGYRLAGLKKQDKEALEKRLGLIRGKAWTIHQQQETGRIIEAYFAEKGFYSPTVQVYTRPDGMRKGYVRLFVQVDRGTRSRISSLTLSGARSLPSRMQNRMTRMIRPWHWTQFWRKAHPSADEIRQAGQQLTLALQEQGFRDAFVKRDSLIRLPDNRFAIEIELEPGNMYYLRQIRWSGHTHLDQDSLMRLLGMETGIPYSMPAIQDRLVMNPSGQSLAGYFQEKGYLFFQAEAVESAVEGDSVDVEIRLIEGPVATIGKIIIEGNDKTSEEVIRRSLYTAPGDTFRRSDIMRSQQELMMLNYFDPEGMDVRPEPDQETGRVDLTYQVAEKSSDLFSLRGTYNPRIKDDDGNAIGGGLTGGLQLDLKNFSTRRLLNRKAWIPFPSGDGQQLSLGFEASGLAYQHYYFRFQEPW